MAKKWGVQPGVENKSREIALRGPPYGRTAESIPSGVEHIGQAHCARRRLRKRLFGLENCSSQLLIYALLRRALVWAELDLDVASVV